MGLRETRAGTDPKDLRELAGIPAGWDRLVFLSVKSLKKEENF
jgi:hypothetical protein